MPMRALAGCYQGNTLQEIHPHITLQLSVHKLLQLVGMYLCDINVSYL